MDLGGHTGLFSLIAASADPAVQVHYFEIMPLIAKRGQTNARISGLSDRITVNNIGLSRAEGKMEVHFNERWPLWTGASLEAIKERVSLKGAQTLEVPVTTLDKYWESNGRFPCSLAKLDVEGHEQAVFEGGAEFLRKNKPVLMCEILSLENLVDFHETLKTLGYDRVYEIDDRNYRIRELGPDLAYADGKPYEFSEYHNALFCAEPLPTDLPDLVEKELTAAGISPPQDTTGDGA
ncbi:FkbM family methyltransferase [Ruegeria marisrubri]|nr:FkbM family methyltransferase [Ruegeria marisrubri]